MACADKYRCFAAFGARECSEPEFPVPVLLVGIYEQSDCAGQMAMGHNGFSGFRCVAGGGVEPAIFNLE